MKKLILLSIMYLSKAASAQTAPVLSVTFNPQPGVTAQATIIVVQSADPILQITQQKPGESSQTFVLSTSQLELSEGGMEGTESSLRVTPKGSLQIVNQNDSVGRDRTERVLTIVFRDGKYVIAGFTNSVRDTVVPGSSGDSVSCDYNLLTGNGIKNGRQVKVTPVTLDLATLVDSEKLDSCDGW